MVSRVFVSLVMKPTSEILRTSLSVAEEPKPDTLFTSEAPPLPITELKLMAEVVVMPSTLVRTWAP
ncbi:hypothetical protein D3C84_1255810 [compost metagenome]